MGKHNAFFDYYEPEKFGNVMGKHEAFRKWVVQRGVQIDGIIAHHFEERGVGIIAERDIKAGEVILTVPTTALRTVQTVPKKLTRALRGMTVHGLLAADLVSDVTTLRNPWCDVLPGPGDFESSMPFFWPQALQELLPSEAASLLANQQAKFAKDWATVYKALPEMEKDAYTYTYSWCIVNTRTFYYVAAGKRAPASRDDCMALNPFADYFNHAAVPDAEVVYGRDGFSVQCSRSISKGEEVYISYGNHSNDFLLAEYGFLLDENKWDVIRLDEVVLTQLSEEQKQSLKDAGFLGNYVLDQSDVCYRTQVALRIQCLSAPAWQRFVDGKDDGEGDQTKVDKILHGILSGFLQLSTQRIQDVSCLEADHVEGGQASHYALLSRRWRQISVLLELAIGRLDKT